MDYFELFNKIVLNNIKLTDITNLVIIKDDIKDYLITYAFSEGETIFDAANNIYGDDKLYWIIYLTNPDLFYEPLKTTEELNEILNKEYMVNAYKLEDFDYSYVTGEYEWYHETVDGLEPIKYFDSTRDLVIANTNKAGTIKIIKDSLVVVPNQTEYLYRDAPKYYKLGDLYLNKLPKNLPVDIDKIEVITFADDLQNKNEEKRTIKVLNPKYKDDLITTIIEKVSSDVG